MCHFMKLIIFEAHRFASMYANFLFCTCITIAKDLTLSTPLLPEGDEPGLRDLPDDGGQMFPVVVAVAWRRGLGVPISTVAALSRGFTLGRGSLAS